MPGSKTFQRRASPSEFWSSAEFPCLHHLIGSLLFYILNIFRYRGGSVGPNYLVAVTRNRNSLVCFYARFVDIPHSREALRQSAEATDDLCPFVWFGVTVVAWSVSAFWRTLQMQVSDWKIPAFQPDLSCQQHLAALLFVPLGPLSLSNPPPRPSLSAVDLDSSRFPLARIQYHHIWKIIVNKFPAFHSLCNFRASSPHLAAPVVSQLFFCPQVLPSNISPYWDQHTRLLKSQMQVGYSPP